ncbi:MAG: hypothetical protein ACE5FQ_13540 [Thiogranum sp.]
MPPIRVNVARFNELSRFTRAFKKLEPDVQQAVKDTFNNLKNNPELPGLNVEKLQGFPGVYSARVNRNYRLSFKMDGDTAILRNVATHDKLYASP